MLEKNIRCTAEAGAEMCFASDAVMKVTTDAVQIFAGSGDMQDTLVEK